MSRMKSLAIMAIAIGVMALMVAPCLAQCGQRQVDPTNALLGIQGGGCANGQCNAASSAASVSALQNEVSLLRRQLAARPASTGYRIANVSQGGGTSASASASSAPRVANRTLYVVPTQAYAVEAYQENPSASASASASSSASAASDVVPSQFAVVPLSASDVQVSNACGSGGCGKRGGGIGARLRARRGGGSFSKSVAISST